MQGATSVLVPQCYMLFYPCVVSSNTPENQLKIMLPFSFGVKYFFQKFAISGKVGMIFLIVC